MALIAFLEGLTKTVSIKRGENDYREQVDVESGRDAAATAEVMAKEATKKNEMILSSSGVMSSRRSSSFAAACSKRGGKGINQDSLTVWQEFGCQDDSIFCGVFDGHGPWGHVISKRIRKSMPDTLLRNWQEANDVKLAGKFQWFDKWNRSCLNTYAAIDQELKLLHPGIDSFCSGSTALTIIKQGNELVVANVGDSRAVLAIISDDGCSLMATQLTIDFKPNLPEEAERISRSRGRVFSMADEPGVYRIWTPKGNSYTPGLAVSRALGDHCMKDFGLISEPEVTHRTLTHQDQFVILATDGVWDVLSNEEAVQIVSSTPNKDQSAKRLVQCAAKAWNRKRRNVAMDDISVICLFFH